MCLFSLSFSDMSTCNWSKSPYNWRLRGGGQGWCAYEAWGRMCRVIDHGCCKGCWTHGKGDQRGAFALFEWLYQLFGSCSSLSWSIKCKKKVTQRIQTEQQTKKTFKESNGLELFSTHICFVVIGDVWCCDGEDIKKLSKEILVCIVIQMNIAIAAHH